MKTTKRTKEDTNKWLYKTILNATIALSSMQRLFSR